MLIEMLNKTNKGTKFKIGKIDILKNHSVFEIDSNNYPKVIKSINGLDFEDRQLVVKVDKEPAGGGSGRDRDRGGSGRDNEKRKPRRKK
jgi:hypothetical protein